ncbi:MAG: hypothetical protein GXZ08_08820 [Tissierellia bacterium]|nr:hypothetical protein [Tissierellia bacterium]
MRDKCFIKRENIKSMVIIGIILAILGFVATFRIDDSIHNLHLAAGFLTGIGTSFVGLALNQYIKYKRMTEDEAMEYEIELKDERNIRIEQMANSLTNKISYLILGTVSFVLILMNYPVPAIINVLTMISISIVFKLSLNYYKSKY